MLRRGAASRPQESWRNGGSRRRGLMLCKICFGTAGRAFPGPTIAVSSLSNEDISDEIRHRTSNAHGYAHVFGHVPADHGGCGL
jgi:hypothetical protein